MSNEMMEVTNTAPVRNIEIITTEIKDICRQAQSMALLYAIEIGRRLEEAKQMLPHGQWGEWLKTEVEFSQSTANNYMRLFEEYGAAQISIFGASVNSQSIANLPYSKALQLLAVPKEEREAFAKEVKAEDLSVKELKDAIAERDRAREAEAALAERLSEVEAAKEDAIKKAAETERLSRELSTKEEELASARKNTERLQAQLKQAEENPTIPKKTLEKIRKEAAEAAKKEAETAASVELEAARQRMQEAKDNEASALKRLDEAEKRLKTASPEVTAFKALFDTVQDMAGRLRTMVENIRQTDPETATKLSAALKAFGASL